MGKIVYFKHGTVKLFLKLKKQGYRLGKTGYVNVHTPYNQAVTAI
jgi:hypothetical protein